MAGNKLSAKRRVFVDVFDGNGSEAARIAGFKHPGPAACRLLKDVNILTAIEARNSERDKFVKAKILSREERQQFWTAVILGNEKEAVRNDAGDIVEVPPTLNHKLKASELLGKSQVDFTERREIEVGTSVSEAIKAFHGK